MKAKVLAVILVALAAGSVVPVASADDVSIRYETQPDEAVLYLGDLVYGRDTVSLPPGDVEVAFPPNVIADSLIVTEDGERVRVLRFRNRNAVQPRRTAHRLSGAARPGHLAVGGDRDARGGDRVPDARRGLASGL